MGCDEISLKRIFPKDDHLWRVDWFGQVLRNPGRESEPDIEVLISPFIGSPRDPANNKAIDNKKQKIILMAVGLLPCIRIGTIWRQGMLLPPNDFHFTKKKFKDVNICPETTQIIRTDHAEQGSAIISPDYYYIKGELAGASRCLGIRFKNKENYIIIPMVELIRFYYVQSTETARSILNGELGEDRNNLYDEDKSRFKNDNAIYELKLNEPIAREDAWIIARIAVSDLAYRNAVNIHASIVKNKLNEGLSYPETFPPFHGITDLTAYGKWINSKTGWHFLIFWIDNCTAPFPFKDVELQWNESGKRIIYDEEEEIEGSGGAGGRRSMKKSKPEGEVQGDVEPSAGMAGARVLLHLNRFSFLHNKKLLRPTKRKRQKCEHRPKKRLSSKEEEEPGKELSTGSGTHGECDVPKLSIKISDVSSQIIDDEVLPDNFKSFLKGLQFLKSKLKDSFHSSLIAVSKPIIKCTAGPISFFPVENPKKASRNKIHWSYLDYKEKERRKVIVAKVIHSDRIVYLFEMELRKIQRKAKLSQKPKAANQKEHHATLLLHSTDYCSIGTQELKDVLLRCALNQGVWLYEEELPVFHREKIVHKWISPEEFARKVFNFQEK